MAESNASEPSRKLSIFAVTWPLLIELFLNILMGSMDTFMLSHVSDDAVAAVGVSNQLVSIMIILFGFISTGTAVVSAQYLGAKKYADATRVAAISVSINFIFGIVMSIFVVLFRHQYFSLMKLPASLIGYADVYLAIVGGTLFIQAMLFTISAVVRSNGFTRDAMLVSLGMNLIHIFGNYLFIFGSFGVPQLGVTGVSISTAVSRTLAVTVAFIIMYRRLQYPIAVRDYLTFDKTLIRKILKIGIPSAGEQLSYQASQVLITAMITSLGTVALATRIYTMNVMFFIMLFGLAMGQGTQIIVGHLIGAGQKEEAYKRLLKSLRQSLLITICVALVVAVFRRHLIGIFTAEPSIIAVGAGLLAFSIILEPGRTFNLVVINSLRAAGDAQFPVIMGILSMWGVSVTMSYFLGIHLGMGLLGFWIAFAMDEWLRGILMYWRWRSRVWESKSLVHKEEKSAIGV